MIDVIVVTAIALVFGAGGLLIASQPVRPSRRETREIEILKSLERIEEGMKQYASSPTHGEVSETSTFRSIPFHNRELLENCRICGCCNCLQVFAPELIKSWTDDGLTACCPYCGIDAVVSDPSGVSLNARTLLSRHHEHFVRRPARQAGDPKSSTSQQTP